MDNFDGPSERIILLVDRRGEHLKAQIWNNFKEQVKEFIELKKEFNSGNEFYFVDIGKEIGFFPLENNSWVQADVNTSKFFLSHLNPAPPTGELIDLSEIVVPIETLAGPAPQQKVLRLIFIYTSLSSIPLLPQASSVSLVKEQKAFFDVIYYVPIKETSPNSAVIEIASTWANFLQTLNDHNESDACFFSFARGPEGLASALSELLVHPHLRDLPASFRASSFVSHPRQSLTVPASPEVL